MIFLNELFSKKRPENSDEAVKDTQEILGSSTTESEQVIADVLKMPATPSEEEVANVEKMLADDIAAAKRMEEEKISAQRKKIEETGQGEPEDVDLSGLDKAA